MVNIWRKIQNRQWRKYYFLSERNHCSTWYTVYYKQSGGGGLCVCTKISIPPPNCVYFAICLMSIMIAATKIHISTDRGTKFLSLTRWDIQWRQHCWHSCGDLPKPTPGLQNEWDPHSWVCVHPFRLWGDTHSLAPVIKYVCVYIITIEEEACQAENYCQTT